MPHKQLLEDSKIKLFVTKNAAFISTVFCSLHQVWDTSINTAATDGLSLLINPDFFTSLDPNERVFLLSHETWHVALKHMLRKENRNHKRWNCACDYFINDMLVQSGMKMPKGGLHDKRFTGLSSEEIYDILESEDDQSEPDYDDLKTDAAGADGQGMTSEEVNATIDSAIIRGSIMAKERGQWSSTPSCIQAEVESLINPKIPWTTILRNLVTELTNEDYSYRRPNRKYLPDFYVPSLRSETVGTIAYYTDISGSVSDAQFSAYIAEITAIHRAMQPKESKVITFDTRIQDEHEITFSTDIAKLPFTGRGGTSLECVRKHMTDYKPEIAIIFSDLDCSPMESHPITTKHIIWVVLDNPQATVPFGKPIYISSAL